MSKIYKPQRLGGSIYLCIPSSFFSSKMLENGVKVELLEKRKGYTVIRLGEVNAEHDVSVEAGRENTPESGLTADVRKTG